MSIVIIGCHDKSSLETQCPSLLRTKHHSCRKCVHVWSTLTYRKTCINGQITPAHSVSDKPAYCHCIIIYENSCLILCRQKLCWFEFIFRSRCLFCIKIITKFAKLV